VISLQDAESSFSTKNLSFPTKSYLADLISVMDLSIEFPNSSNYFASPLGIGKLSCRSVSDAVSLIAKSKIM